MTVSINGTSGLTFNDASTQNTAASGFGFKNRLINGSMQIDQRNAGASVTQSNSIVYTLDRWGSFGTVTSKFTIQRNAGSVTPPAGFTNYLGCTSTSSYSVGASELYEIFQMIEGFNTADLNWGTANASPVTISFWVRSSLTGTFGGFLNNSASNRTYPFSYTINSANTWEQKSVTIAGDTIGTWLTNNGIGIQVAFNLGCGSSLSGTANTWNSGTAYSPTGAVSVVGTNGATFYITGVQLEKGSTATSFDYRPYGTELALCQRYCLVYSNATDGSVRLFGWNYLSSIGVCQAYFPVQTRVAPSGIRVVNAGTMTFYSGSTSYAVSSIAYDAASNKTCNVSVTLVGSPATVGFGNILALQASGNLLEFTGMEL
jgi:hypothetical protein